ncbi:MAG TPA: YMGG-like glycine zipper-containing protein, partial [Pyrinomonadaceae bacterium]
RLNRQVQSDWTQVRTDLNSLSAAYGLTWQWNQQTYPGVSSTSGRLSDDQLGQLIRRIDSGGEAFRTSLTDAFGERRYDQSRSEGTMNERVRVFKNATDQLRNQFESKQPVAVYVERLLASAAPIDSYMRDNRLTDRVHSDWLALRGDLNTLGHAYNTATNWPISNETPIGFNADSRLTGTFRLDPTRSDNPQDVADRATRNLSNNQRQTTSNRLLMRLESPETLAMERRGSTITLASSRAPQQTFEADGAPHQEQIANRRTQVTATLRGDQLSVSSTGYRENDFDVTFESIDNGKRLRVKRQIYLDRIAQPVVVNSVYNRTSEAPQWNIYNGAQPVLGSSGGNNDFIVRDGETLVAVLNDNLSTQQAQPGDRFSMTVREPGQHAGAVIEGTVGSVEQGGRVTGRAGLTLNFDTIRLQNGQTHRFAGAVSGVRMPSGDSVNVDNEGTAQGGNQTTQTVQRAGIGTAIGAIIGAVAGGAKGAVIGAVVGAAGGAGSVYVQGKDNLELPSGTELTIRASAPR